MTPHTDLSSLEQSPSRMATPRRSARAHREALAVALLLGLTLLTAWNRAVFDSWLTRYDLFTQIIPWYAYLGEQLRAGDIPGWNPYQLSGTPFAGHPLSGWMYAPTMLVFAIFPAIVGFKVFMTGHLLLAAGSTYAFARVLGLRIAAALVAAVAFTFGPFLEWTTYTSLQFAQFAVWVPLALLGVELAFQQRTWRDRFLPWGIGAVAISQMLAGWVGEGWIYALLLVGGYVLYRGACDALPRVRLGKQQLLLTASTGISVLAGGFALAAAGVLPRLSVNSQTTIHGADYSAVGSGGVLNRPWTVHYLVAQLLGLGNNYHFRAAQVGSAVVVLALLALVLTPRRFGVPFFAISTAASLILTLPTTPVHRVFYLIPGYQELHQHDPWRAIALASIGPAMMSGAAVHALMEGVRPKRPLPLIVVTGGSIGGAALALHSSSGIVRWAPALAAFAMTLLALALVIAASHPRTALVSHARSFLLPALMLAVVFLQPTGLELSGSWLGWPSDHRWAKRLHEDPSQIEALRTELMFTDPDGAGAYLQQQLDSGQPFRYLGYGGVNTPGGRWYAASYMSRRFDPGVLAILVNGRPLMLGLDEVQGYDPVQLSRYAALIKTVNGTGQNYHTAFIDDHGLESPMLDLLDVRYVLVPDTLPLDRPDMVWLIETSKVVFRGPHVTVYEREPVPAAAWIVHEVRSVAPNAALALISDGSIDAHRTALIEGTAPRVPPLQGATADRAIVTDYRPDHIEIVTHTAVQSFLVISEVYADGWTATVNGTKASIYPTDHTLRGLVIPAGDATIELRYEPRALRVGMAISGLATLLLIGVVLDAIYRHWRASAS